MTKRPICSWHSQFVLLIALAAAAPVQASGELVVGATWHSVTSGAVSERLDTYLNTTNLEASRQAEVRDLWRSDDDASQEPGSDVLTRLAACLAKADDRITVLFDFCSGVVPDSGVPEFAWLADSEMHPFARNNMRLFLARWLVQQGYYDEAVSWMDGLKTDDVVAPEALLFYRAVAHHRLVQADPADAAVSQLLQRQEELPLRFQKLAVLMQQDLAGLEDESLDHISRRMEDIRRRLAQGRSDKRVQDIESGVVESLDKLIKQAEAQMQKQQACAAAPSGGQQSQTPMDDSRLPRMKAPGDVERRDIGDGTGWGDLPDKEREKALQGIGREFPSHYREVIEEYFRRLAAEETAEKP